jgi:serine/threonine-protein kinase
MEKKGYLNWKETLHFAIQIAKALEHAHSRGIVHRDIKPHNVMVLKNGSVKVADFGIARVMSKSNTLTKEALGSVHYISPEQAKGGRVDNRSDIYSLGVVMYEMIAGRVPYDGESPVAVAIQHINGGAPRPSYYNPNTPAGLEKIITKSMSLSPSDRYESATAMLYDMDEFRKNPEQAARPGAAASGRTGGNTSPSSIAERKVNRQGKTSGSSQTKKKEAPVKRNRVATIALAACALVAIISVVILCVVSCDGEDPSHTATVQVPNLLGMDFNALTEFQDIQVEYQGSEYSSRYPKDQIIRQYPPAGHDVIVGTTVYVTVSLGEEAPPVKTMENLVGEDSGQAQKFLNGLNLKLDIRVNEENDPSVPVGTVIRTEPEEGKVLNEGQRVILWVSKGPEAVKAAVPNVVGMDIGKALFILEANGFRNVIQNPVDSTAKTNEVVAQSIEKNKKVEVTTEIVLDVSTGVSNLPTEPEETQPEESKPEEKPTEEPEETIPEGTVQLEYAFLIPSRTEQYELSIRIGEQVFLKSMTIQPGVSSVTIPLVGNGEVVYDLYINGEFFDSVPVVFDPDE